MNDSYTAGKKVHRRMTCTCGNISTDQVSEPIIGWTNTHHERHIEKPCIPRMWNGQKRRLTNDDLPRLKSKRRADLPAHPCRHQTDNTWPSNIRSKRLFAHQLPIRKLDQEKRSADTDASFSKQFCRLLVSGLSNWNWNLHKISFDFDLNQNLDLVFQVCSKRRLLVEFVKG